MRGVFKYSNVYHGTRNRRPYTILVEIHSHPVALLQCKNYLQKFPPHFKIIEGTDTASVAKKIKEENLKGVAAIAGKQVAEKFGLKILESKIQNNSQNQTRFVLVGKNNKTLFKRSK